MKYLFLFIALIGFNASICSQNKVTKNEGAWFTVSSKFVLSNKVSSNFVFQKRRLNFLQNSQAFLISPSLNYKLTNNLSVGVGYLKFTTLPSTSTFSIRKNENRFFQDFLFISSNEYFKTSNRFRFEQRKIEKLENNKVMGYKKANRMRYRFELSKKLFTLKNEKDIIGKFSNEIRIRFQEGLTAPEFDQNNFALLIGTSITQNGKVWLGYGNYFFKKSENEYLQNHLLHINYTQVIDFRN